MDSKELVSSTGDGLSIILDCECSFLDNWSSFSAYYSFSKNIPDAQIYVVCKRKMSPQYFSWCNKLQVPLFQYSCELPVLDVAKKQFNILNQMLVLKPQVMAIRPYNYNYVGPSFVNSGEYTTFVDYSAGFGTFNLNGFIDEVPFYRATRRFFTQNSNVNELKVLKCWEQLDKLYIAVGI